MTSALAARARRLSTLSTAIGRQDVGIGGRRVAAFSP